MTRIEVGLGERSYDIAIERGSVSGGGFINFFNNRTGGEPGSSDSLLRASGFDACAVVTDESVFHLYGQDFLEALGRAGAVATPVVIAPGEASKNLSVFGSLMDLFAAAGLSRKSLILALGGGVVGDLAGFAAACWMRGIRYAQIPTTLLAMVDSSVGGKTAIDIPAGKNLVGAFHQPSFVVIDPDLLVTLPPREFKSGMAEVVKCGAISSFELFEDLERMAAAGQGADDLLLEDVIASCIRIKADIVSADEFDTGRRQILNFGHTFGHALEVRGGFSKYTHGEAVAAGMRIAARYGEATGITEAGTAARLCALLDAIGLETKGETKGDGSFVSKTNEPSPFVSGAVVPLRQDDSELYTELVSYMKNDKKASAGTINLVLLKRLGEAVIVPVSLTELEAGLRKLQD